MLKTKPIANLPLPLTQRLASIRTLGYRLLTPLDAVCRQINRKSDLPPLWLRRYVGPVEVFESAAAEFAALLKTLGNLQPSSKLLDLGCGCGALALQLRNFLKEEQGGAYIGVDVHRESIRWCQANFRQPHFQFFVIDAFNATFRPDGQQDFDYVSFLSKFAPVDVVAAKSLFTHLRPREVESYLAAVARVLLPGGRCVFSVFMFSDQDDLARTEVVFPYGDEHFRHAYAHRVESAVAHSEQSIQEMLERNGLRLVYPPFRGGWRSSGAGLTFQDVLVVAKQE